MGHYVKTEEHVILFVEDIGHGRPIIFLHGWPLNHKMFEYQMNEFRKGDFVLSALICGDMGNLTALGKATIMTRWPMM